MRRLAHLGLVLSLASIAPAIVAAAPEPPTNPPLPPPEVRAWQVGLLRPDRLQHTGLSYSSGLVLGLPTGSPTAAASSFALGIAKELWDLHREGRFDWVDLTADAVGAAGAALTTITISR